MNIPTISSQISAGRFIANLPSQLSPHIQRTTILVSSLLPQRVCQSEFVAHTVHDQSHAAHPKGDEETTSMSQTHRKHGARGKLQPSAPDTTSTPEAPYRPAEDEGKSSSSQSPSGGAMK